MKISFDWDSTLSRQNIQEYAKELLERGVGVWIITSRYDDEHLQEKFGMQPAYAQMGNQDIYEEAPLIGIPSERIIFTNMLDKHHFIQGEGFIWHLDDDCVENDLINKYTKTIGISSIRPNWRRKCEKVLYRWG